MFFFYDWTMILVLPGLLLALYAQAKISSTYNRFSSIHARAGLTAAECARDILQNGGAGDVRVERVAGTLTDHYDPREKVLRLSEGTYNSTSIAALGVAAHEAGHALQDAQDYAPLTFRSLFAPVASIGSNAAVPLFMLGLLFSWEPLVKIGLICFALAVVFSLVTLPVEFNASHRALETLEGEHILEDEEMAGARKVLRAAALTYVAALLSSLLQLLRYVLFFLNRSGNRRGGRQ